MKRLVLATVTVALASTSVRAALTTFTYSQSDQSTGTGTIAPFVLNDAGGPISFGATPMPAAVVFNPLPGAQTPAGFVGEMNAPTGNSNEPNVAVGLTWTGSVTATGTRGGTTYKVQIPLKFVDKQTQTPTDTNDYNWNVAFGDSPANGADAVGTPRFAMYLSRDTVIDNAETSDTFQRYTQLTHTLVAGPDSFTNTDLTTTAIKDATDPAGAPTGVDAANRDLAFYYGWRDGASAGTILVDSFAVGGLLNADESTLQAVPEPSAVMLVAGASLLGLRRRRRA